MKYPFQLLTRCYHRYALTSLCLLVLTAEGALLAAVEQRPNIVLILADDVGREAFGCYGGTSYQTPRIDELARSSAKYMQCFSMPSCHPTRVTLLTGQYPRRLGNPRWGTFPPSKNGETIARVMKQAGYATAVAGKWQLTLLKDNPDHPRELGFDEWCLFGWHEGPRFHEPLIWRNGELRDDVSNRYGPDVYREFLLEFAHRHAEQPFFLFYSMALCHDVTDDLGAPVPYSPGKNRYDTFHEMVEEMDNQVGQFVSALTELGLRENTLILFTGDNGSPPRSIIRAENGSYIREPVVSKMGDRSIPGGKGQLTDTGTGVPLLASWPGVIAPGTMRDDLVDLSDFLPTCAEVAGAKLPAGVNLDGRSFAQQLRGSAEAHRSWVYAERQDGQFWVRVKRWKLYNSGRLFDMQIDPKEQQSVPPAEDTVESAAARNQLQAVIETLPFK
jgi:arylsulfatase A